MTTYHHHIAAYYLHLANKARAEGRLSDALYGKAFLYFDFA